MSELLGNGRLYHPAIENFCKCFGVRLARIERDGLTVASVDSDRKDPHLRVGDVLREVSMELLERGPLSDDENVKPVLKSFSFSSHAEFDLFVEHFFTCHSDRIQVEVRRPHADGSSTVMTYDFPNPWLKVETFSQQAEAKIKKKLAKLPQETINQLYLDLQAAKAAQSPDIEKHQAAYDDAFKKRERLSFLLGTISSKLEPDKEEAVEADAYEDVKS